MTQSFTPQQRLFRRWYRLIQVSSTRRLVYGLVGAVVVAFLPWSLPLDLRILVGWIVGATIYLALSWGLVQHFDATRTAARAGVQDQPGIVIFFIMLLAIVVCVGAIAAMLTQLSAVPPAMRGVHIAISLLALTLSWMLIHTLFAFRYAHRYYFANSWDSTPAASGLNFPGGHKPDYQAFMYHSYVIGMTTQVSDVQVTSREMRYLVLQHGMLAFAFNMLILALGINVVASVI